MRGKRLTMEVRLHALDPFGARRDPDAIAAAFAQPFKTSPAPGDTVACPTVDRAGISMTSQTIFHAGIWRPVLTLILASVVIMGSPGPSTMSATAVGAAYGFRRSLLYACGLILGTTAVLFAVAVGVVTLLLSIPHGAPVLVAVSAAYILYLAFRIATAPPLARQRDRGRRPCLRRRLPAGRRQSQGLSGHRCRIRRVQHRRRGRRARRDGQDCAARCDDRDHPSVLASGGRFAVPCPAQIQPVPASSMSRWRRAWLSRPQSHCWADAIRRTPPAHKNPIDSQGNATTIASATARPARYGHIRQSASSGDTRPIAHAP